jgi:hypothetical protein
MRRKKSSSKNARLARTLTDKPSTSVVVGSSILYLIMLTILIIIANAIN